MIVAQESRVSNLSFVFTQPKPTPAGSKPLTNTSVPGTSLRGGLAARPGWARPKHPPRLGYRRPGPDVPALCDQKGHARSGTVHFSEIIGLHFLWRDGSFCRANWWTLQVTVVHARAVGATGRSPLHRTDAGKKVLGFINQF